MGKRTCICGGVIETLVAIATLGTAICASSCKSPKNDT